MKIIFVIGCSTTGKGRSVTYLPRDQKYRFYASILQEKLGNEYDVRQGGEGGVSISEAVDGPLIDGSRTVLNDLINIVTNKKAFDRCFENKRDFEKDEFIFIHYWGVNDADTRNVRKAEKDFVASYNDYLKLFPRGKHYICYLAPVFGKYPGHTSGHEINTINALIPQVKGDGYIDLRWGWTPDMMYDKVHPNTKGANHTANIMAKEITAQPTVDPPTNDNEYHKAKIIEHTNKIK